MDTVQVMVVVWPSRNYCHIRKVMTAYYHVWKLCNNNTNHHGGGCALLAAEGDGVVLRLFNGSLRYVP